MTKNSVNENLYIGSELKKNPVWIELDWVGFNFSGRFQFHTNREHCVFLAWTEFAVLL